MALTILDSTASAAAAAAADQTAARAALLTALGAGNIRVRYYAGATVVEVSTHGPAVPDSANPRGFTLGSLLASTVNVSDATVTHATFAPDVGGAEVFRLEAADLVLSASTTKTDRRINCSDVVLQKLKITASAGLPVSSSPSTSLTWAGPSSGTVGVESGDFTATLLNGSGSVVVTPSSSASATFNPTTRTLTPGAPTGTFRMTALAAAMHSVSLANDAGITAPPAVSYTASATPPSPAPGLPANYAAIPLTVGTLPAAVAAGSFAVVASGSGTLDTKLFVPHMSSVYMPARRAMYFFGAETHENPANYPNSPYHLDLDTGAMYQDLAHSPCPGEYRIDATGIPWADAAHSRPWGQHGMRHVTRYSADEWLIAYSTLGHANYFGSNPAIYEGAYNKTNYRQAIWFYNTRTLQWRYEDGGALNANVSGFLSDAQGYGVVYSAARGSIMSNLAGQWKELNLATFARESSSPSLTANQYNSFSILLDSGIVMTGAGGDSGDTTLFDLVNPSSPGSFTSVLKSSVPMLSGYTIAETAWVKTALGNVLLFAKDAALNQLHVFIYAPGTGTWTDTGHTLTVGSEGMGTRYWFNADWADDFGCVILASNINSTLTVWAYKPNAGV